ncbi:peptide chain release factor H [Clostridium formicaceticum]|uniref:Peptide chain release factor 2 n=1 Tax=Clostridium formicaceticum TaxID=1497 RepID=A0AAC9RGG7_9CLOT|nr:peptide chain release factor H [Clostridium formicaceticum]AOY76031.1 peptide chain release factor-like protein [Clostridium formicaceticum]ARE86389.1 Peptide chain release factor 2 [Clostridium formicaceticum]
MLMQISSGKGPAECELAVGKFLKILMKEMKDIKIVQEVKGQYVDCYKSLVLSVEEDVSDLEGTIKWVAQSPFRPKHKRKNWFIDVSMFKEQVKIDFSDKVVRFETFRCGGNGGQNVNKVETGARAIHTPTGLTVVCTEARTQHLNKKLALNRLSEMISKQNLDAQILAKQVMWIQHELLERGNPIRVYEGLTFKRIK